MDLSKSKAALAGALVLGTVVLVCVTVLIALGKDPTLLIAAVGTAVTPLVGALLYGRVEQVREQSNGNVTRLLDMVQASHPLLPNPTDMPALPDPHPDQ